MSVANNTMTNTAPPAGWRAKLSDWAPQLILAPSLLCSFVYIFVFSAWTIYISLSNSSLLPSYEFVGFEHYVSLWQNRRWNVAYNNLFIFSVLYVIGSMAVGLFLAVLIDQRVRGESVWRTIYLYPLAVSFVVTGTVWNWLFNPTSGIETFVRGLGFESFAFAWITDRNLALYTVVITGIWHASGFAMALFLAGLRSVEQDLIKAAQIDGASLTRIYMRIVLPAIRPIFLAVLVILLQFAIKTFDLVVALTGGGPGIATTMPAIVVYDFMFQRGQIAEGAAAAIMILLALAVVVVPYVLWTLWSRRGERMNG
ncbi:MAG: sugar ABC transporter permease [Geminicoccaceae bacterium]